MLNNSQGKVKLHGRPIKSSQFERSSTVICEAKRSIRKKIMIINKE